MTFLNETGMPRPLSELWKENHGNALVTTLVIILIVGASILAYEQTRFTPVGFPDAKSIQGQRGAPSVANENDQLVLEITNAENDSGSIMVAVFADEASFQGASEAVIRQTLDISDQKAVLSIPLSQLPSRFAVSAFHDKDNDRSLGTNAIGIPTERYGFSRDARGRLGPPDFLDAAIDRPESQQTVTISLR
jgi:uncharacterized protein (DUF2141 family)